MSSMIKGCFLIIATTRRDSILHRPVLILLKAIPHQAVTLPRATHLRLAIHPKGILQVLLLHINQGMVGMVEALEECWLVVLQLLLLLMVHLIYRMAVVTNNSMAAAVSMFREAHILVLKVMVMGVMGVMGVMASSSKVMVMASSSRESMVSLGSMVSLEESSRNGSKQILLFPVSGFQFPVM